MSGAVSRTVRWLWLGRVGYQQAWEWQKRIAAARHEGEISDECVLLLEHQPVYTMGRNGRPEHIRSTPDDLRARGAEYWEVDRGGSITFHGPGQLVAYPMVDLASVFPIAGTLDRGDVLQYLRALEAALCATARSVGVQADVRPPYTGAWVGGNKLAAIGVKLAKGITMHGVALNVNVDLRWFDAIIPCGIDDGGVTSLEREGGSIVDAEQLAGQLAGDIAKALGQECLPDDGTVHSLLLGDHEINTAAA